MALCLPLCPLWRRQSRLQSLMSWTWAIVTLDTKQTLLCETLHGESRSDNEQLNGHFRFLSYLFFFPKESNCFHASLIRKLKSLKFADIFAMWKELGNELSKKRLVKWLFSLGFVLFCFFFKTIYFHIHLAISECLLGSAVALVPWGVSSWVGVQRTHNLQIQRDTMNFSWSLFVNSI